MQVVVADLRLKYASKSNKVAITAEEKLMQLNFKLGKKILTKRIKAMCRCIIKPPMKTISQR